MNELPVIEAYSRPDRVSVLYFIVIFILGLMVMMSIGDRDDLMEYLFVLGTFTAVSVILVIRSRRMKRPVLRTMYDVLRLEFKDARKPVMIQMSNLSVAVEDMYKFILERI